MKLFLYAVLLAAGLGCAQRTHAMFERLAWLEKPDLDMQLILAVHDGNVAGVEELIKLGADVNAKVVSLIPLGSRMNTERGGMTPLRAMHRERVYSETEYLPKPRPVDIAENEKRRKLMTPEEQKRSVKGQRPDYVPVARLLLDAGAAINERDNG